MPNSLTRLRQAYEEYETVRQWNRDQGLYDLRTGLNNLLLNANESDRFDVECIRAALERIEAREDEG